MSRKKFFWTAEQDELIRKRYDSRTETITDLARIFSVPRWAVRRRAGMLGVSRVKELPWSSEEVAFLEANYSKKSVFWISKKLHRSVTAILMKKRRLGLRKTDDGYTLRMVCEGFGVDHHKVGRWIKQGWLKPRGRGVDRPQGDYRFFTDEALRRFVRKHPDQIDLRRVEKLWFIDLLAGLNISVPDFEGIGDVVGVG